MTSEAKLSAIPNAPMNLSDEEREAVLRESFIALKLEPAASDWLLRGYRAMQFLDDLADGGKITRERLDSAIWDLLYELPANPFFARHATSLLALISITILKWQAADRIERDGAADARTFVWRASFYDIVLAVLAICHGPAVASANAHLVLGLYGENFESYLKEFRKDA